MEPKEKKKIIRESAAMVLLAALLGFGVNLFHPKGFILVSREFLALKKIVSLSTVEARIKFDSASAVFIDSRDAEEFSRGHIQGARNIPAEPESDARKRIREADIPPSKELVLYCLGKSCGSSEALARLFVLEGYRRNIYVMEEGYPEWADKDYPVDR